jgi:hypothetical protein
MTSDSCGYDTRQEGLYYPQRVDSFVRFKDKPELHLAQSRFDYCQAWWFACFAHLAYHDEDDIRNRLEQHGMQLVKVIQTKQLFCFLGKNNNGYVLAFRGTQYKNTQDAKTDINFPKIAVSSDFVHNELKVHRGFVAALNSAWDQIEVMLNTRDESLPISYTGHSLGAALAILCAQRIKPSQVYTYGSPKLGNDLFKQYCSDINVHRVVLCADLVCMLPPKSMRFHAIGEEYFINANDTVSHNPGKPFKVRHRLWEIIKYWFTFNLYKPGRIGFRTLADHSIVNYANALWRLCHSGTAVPDNNNNQE